MSERPRVCFDRVLPRDAMRPQSTRRRRGRVRAIAPRGKAWINGTTLTVRFLGGSPNDQAVAREQAGWWAKVANIKFDFNGSPNADIRISFDPTDGAWSYIGTDCRTIPLNQATMNLGFLDGGTAAHEFGHAIGLAHEHQNPAVGIQWNESVVIRQMAGPRTSGTRPPRATTSSGSTRSIRSTGRTSIPIRSCCTSSPPPGRSTASVRRRTKSSRRWTRRSSREQPCTRGSARPRRWERHSKSTPLNELQPQSARQARKTSSHSPRQGTGAT